MRALLLTLGCLLVFCPAGFTQEGGPNLQKSLETVYLQWRGAVIEKNYVKWAGVTARNRQIAVRNRIFSERRAFPAAIFDLPVAPPTLAGLKAVRIESRGKAAKAVYFGKVDFGVPDEKLTENLLVLNFVRSAGGWKYDEAEFVNLSALQEDRKKLAAGDLSYVKSPEFGPETKSAPAPYELKSPVKYITKVYVYSPGREVEVLINKISRHRFQNTKAAEVVIGGARDGKNEVQFGIKRLPGGTGKESMTVRVYLMSEVRGVDPIKVFEYQIAEGEVPKKFGTSYFEVTKKQVGQLQGR